MDGIQDLDLEMIKRKLMDQVEGEGWGAADCDAACQEYRRFLALARAYHGQHFIVPSAVVDKVWHMHILDTRKYGPDCERALGFFLHHFPYFGMRGPEDEAALHDAAQQTLELYRRHFGEPPADIWASHLAPKCGAPLSAPKCGAPAAGVPKCGAPIGVPKCGAPMGLAGVPKCGAPMGLAGVPKCGAPMGLAGVPKCGAPAN
jgi:hypothetical protein